MSTILVSGVGGGVGQSILKSLQGSSHEVIAADSFPLAAGIYAASKSYLVPLPSDPNYIDALLEICRSERVCILFPGLDEELPVLSAARERFKKIGVTAVVSDPEVVAMCDDKLATARLLSANGFSAPRTCLLAEDVLSILSFPMVLKPRCGGCRSKGVFVVESVQELRQRLSQLEPSRYVAQEWIDGDEYTCGTVNFSGECLGVILLRRILRNGDTYKAFVVKDPQLTEFVKNVMQVLRPFGPCNAQLRVRDSIPYIFEFNARCSGTTACRSLAGFNEPLMIANYLLLGQQPVFDIREISILRYWKELVVEPNKIFQFTKDGRIEGAGNWL
jgi:carbamoyl-phosphate synthase large subunit